MIEKTYLKVEKGQENENRSLQNTSSIPFEFLCKKEKQ